MTIYFSFVLFVNQHFACIPASGTHCVYIYIYIYIYIYVCVCVCVCVQTVYKTMITTHVVLFRALVDNNTHPNVSLHRYNKRVDISVTEM
jgi:hypothetical protein